jgi:uncharacterized protein YaiL (DUF2058 family)
MFDLKAKLLAQGLVTKEQIEKAEQEKKRPQENNDNFESRERQKALLQLKSQNKNEQYTTVRKWVDFNRLDKEGMPGDYEKFFVSTKDNQVTWLTLPKSVIEAISSGKAGVINYMSNHGLVHAVVPRDIAEDIGQIFPEWLKVLNEIG